MLRSGIRLFLLYLALGFGGIFFLTTGMPALSPAHSMEKTARAQIGDFLTCVNGKDGKRAYGYLSEALRREVSQRDFLDGLEKIDHVVLVSLSSRYESRAIRTYLVKLRVKEWEEGALSWKSYKGEVALILEKNSWRFIRVDFIVPTDKARKKPQR